MRIRFAQLTILFLVSIKRGKWSISHGAYPIWDSSVWCLRQHNCTALRRLYVSEQFCQQLLGGDPGSLKVQFAAPDLFEKALEEFIPVRLGNEVVDFPQEKGIDRVGRASAEVRGQRSEVRGLF